MQRTENGFSTMQQSESDFAIDTSGMADRCAIQGSRTVVNRLTDIKLRVKFLVEVEDAIEVALAILI